MKKNWIASVLLLGTWMAGCLMGSASASPAWGVETLPESSVSGQNQETEYRLESYLQAGPLSFRLPAFHQEKDINGKAFDMAALFAYPAFEKEMDPFFRVKAGDVLDWRGLDYEWKEVGADEELAYGVSDSNWNAWVLTSFALRTPLYDKASLELAFAPAFELYMDGKKVMSQMQAQDTNRPSSHKAVLKLEPGYHQFMLKALYTSETVDSKLEVTFKASADLALGPEVQEYYDLHHYLDGAVVAAPQLSASGKYFKLAFTQSNPEAEKYETVYRIYRTSDVKAGSYPAPVCELSGISGLAFAGKVDKYAYMKREGSTVRIYAGELGQPASLVYETKESLSGFAWDPQGRYMILSVTTQGKQPENGLKNIIDPMDQWPYYRMRTTLSMLDLASETRVPLTYGYLSTDLMDISLDGRYLLFTTIEVADTMRQYTYQRVYRMDLEDFETEELYGSYFQHSASFSPDGSRLLVMGSERIFTDPMQPGVSVPCQEEDCFIPNDYDVNAFIYDIATGEAELISDDFAPSFQRAVWESTGQYIYLYADDRDEVNLFSYRVSDGTFARVPAQVQVVSGMDVCDNGLLYVGSSIDKPSRAYWVKGSAAKNEFASSKGLKNTFCVAYPQQAEMEQVAQGANRDWSYLNAFGDTIEATYYLPPDFDATKKYPCIVYYYGGTTPTPKAIAVRYPKTVWASEGYVVLVLQPSGAIGYGREFAAKHVNDWGKIVADEIVMGVKQFCQEHPFVDASRLGCIGASYGGFTTQLLQTRTDIFAAAISHAGISSISSYWGEGYWGYLYGSTANAFSFPWNRKDIFVDQSPLFNADKIHTPLLLLHGTADVNVPIGESYQMFKALRLLGRPVAMVTVAGEDHGIVDYAKRVDWEKTILAWFEKYLKGNPAWWSDLY